MAGTSLSRGNILYELVLGVSMAPTSVTNGTSSTQTFSVPGLITSDYVDAFPPAAQTNGIFIASAWCSAPGVMSVQFSNWSGSPATPAAGTYLVNIIRAESYPLPTAF